MSTTLQSGGMRPLTLPIVSRTGSAIDPLVSEISWVAWSMANADPRSVNSMEAASHVRGWMDEVIETLHTPGRSSFVSEVSTRGPEGSEALQVLFAVGMMGPEGCSSEEAIGAAQVVHATSAHRRGFPYRLEQVSPLLLLDLPGTAATHSALIRQVERTMPIADRRIKVLSRFNPPFDPMGKVASLLLERGAPTSVRTTILATTLSVADHLELDASLVQANRLSPTDWMNPEDEWNLKRIVTTLIDLKTSFTTPLLIGEVACFSDDALPETLLRAVAGAFTSESGVTRRQDRVVVAGGSFILGGFELERGPSGVGEALSIGLPLSGGLRPRQLRDLFSLTESPVCWPIPFGLQGVPSIPMRTIRARQVADELLSGTWVGAGPGGVQIHIPESATNRHALVLGESGSGKSRFQAQQAVTCLRTGTPFILIDPHGSLAEHVMAHARSLGREVTLLDADASQGVALSPFPALDSLHGNIDDVSGGIGRTADAIAGTTDPAYTGPRWRQFFMTIGMIASVYRIKFGPALDRFADEQSRAAMIKDSLLPSMSIRTLRLLNDAGSRDTAETVDWTISKLDAITSGVSRRLLTAPGEGLDIAQLMREGRSLVINLAGLTNAELILIGSISLATIIDAAKRERLTNTYRVLVDEAPLFHVQQMESIFAEGRKFNLSLTLAAQSLDQFPRGSMQDAVAAAAVKLAFRQSALVAPQVAHLMNVEPAELYDQPDLHAFLKVNRFPATWVQLPPYEAPPAAPPNSLPINTATVIASPPAPTTPSNPGPRPAKWLEEWMQSIDRRLIRTTDAQ